MTPQPQQYVCSCCEGEACKIETYHGAPTCGCINNSDIGALWIKSARHTSASSQQRIEQVIEVLCKVDNRIGDLHYKATKDGSNMIATGLQQARNVIDNEIALLQAGDGK